MNTIIRHRGTWKGIALATGVLVAFAVGHELRSSRAWLGLPVSSAAPPGRANSSAEGPGKPVQLRDGSPRSEAPPATVTDVSEEPQVFVFVPVYHPRSAIEWQGMLVDVSHQASCERSAQCGLAMACHEGRCGPCEKNSECAPGEVCVLDHCVPVENVECHGRADCGAPRSVCALSGYSPDPRSNKGMRAYCLDELGGTDQSQAQREEQPNAIEPQPKPTLERRLLQLVGAGSPG